jgi:hypothetical protein
MLASGRKSFKRETSFQKRPKKWRKSLANCAQDAHLYSTGLVIHPELSNVMPLLAAFHQETELLR